MDQGNIKIGLASGESLENVNFSQEDGLESFSASKSKDSNNFNLQENQYEVQDFSINHQHQQVVRDSVLSMNMNSVKIKNSLSTNSLN